MKKNVTLLLLAAGSVFTIKSQVVFSENFTATFTPATAGWDVQNLSSPLGTGTWVQGTPSVFPAYNGSAADYFAVNFASQGSTSGGISNWLSTPVVTIYNGAVIEFATRTSNQGTTNPFPDRLQLRMSTAGTSSTVPAGTTSVGPFTDLLLDINPNTNTVVASAVNNGSVNGYPNAWTVYSVQISGVTGTVTGRFAFRYFVNNGGASGLNSNYVGIDAVKYTFPCGPTVQSYTTCAGASTTLQATGLPATTYSWSNSSTSSSIVVSPLTTTVYTLTPANGTISCGTTITSTITIAPQMAINVSASSATNCPGATVVLSASAAATSYSWTIGTTPIGGGSTIAVTPTATTTYSIGAFNGNCFGTNGITINVNISPSLSLAINPSPLCLGAPGMTVTASGANTYTYIINNAQLTTNPLTAIAVPTLAGIYQFGLVGKGVNGCSSSGTATFVVNSNPIVTVTSSTVNACTNSTITFTGSGADTYSWSGAASSTTNPLSFATGATPGPQQFTVVGTSSVGCKASSTFTQNVVVCTTTAVGIPDVNGYDGMSIFPNPFSTELNINGLDGNVLIYNALGQEVIISAINSSQTINTFDLPKGAYMVKAFNSNGELVKTLKLIKN